MRIRQSHIIRQSPRVECLERRELLNAARVVWTEAHVASRGNIHTVDVAPAGVHATTPVTRPVTAAATSPSTATFIDPTAVIHDPSATMIGMQVYVAPFATLNAMGGGTITIGNGSNVQDSVEILALGPRANVVIGDHVILAHNATIDGPATIGATGGAPAFVGFNAIIDGATVEPGAMVSSLAKVAPGIVIPTGFKVLPGMYIRTQAQAENPALGKVVKVSGEDIKFMNDVIHVNELFAEGYSEQADQSPSSVFGIGPNPPTPPFNPTSSSPVLAGVSTTDPSFRNRIIGDVRMANSLSQLQRVMGQDDSIRGDEASPFVIGKIARMENHVTIHGLEYSNLASGHGDSFGFHSVIHGGLDSGQDPKETTVIGSGVRVGQWAVVFRSTIGNNCVIGPYAYVDGSRLAPGTVVPAGAIIVNNRCLGRVQWIVKGAPGRLRGHGLGRFLGD
jgi:carbonic anhydrase/acetyltransferase-like protein (isoleucine patch superfamily)